MTRRTKFKELLRKNKDMVDYDFENTSLDEFKLDLELGANQEIFKYIFDLIMPIVKKASKGNLPNAKIAEEGIKHIEEVNLKKFFGEHSQRYLSIINTAMKGVIRNVEREVEQEFNINIIRTKINNAIFIQEQNGWKIQVKANGTYAQ